jgi:4-hydroxy-tetrahydrodipicolinate synthase
MAHTILGCGTALVTPFHHDGSIDEPALRRFVQFQLREGIDFLVPCGATGEEPTLDHAEFLRVVRVVIEEVKGQVPVVPGVGGNDTRKVVDLARQVKGLGVDGILSVAPFYNKPTQEGLYQHFRALAEAVDLPVILYNVPGRTGLNMEPATVVRLAQIANIVGIKEASGNILQQTEILLSVPSSFKVFSGFDSCTFPLMCLGAVGAISVAANEVPGPMTRLIHLLLEGKHQEARQLNRRLWPLMQANFLEITPLPVKAALAMMGYIEESFRLPLVPMKPETRAKLRQVLDAQGLLPCDPDTGEKWQAPVESEHALSLKE